MNETGTGTKLGVERKHTIQRIVINLALFLAAAAVSMGYTAHNPLGLPTVRHIRASSVDDALHPVLINGTASQPIAQPKPTDTTPKPNMKLYGATGTPIVGGFLTDMQEYNPDWRGRQAFPICEQMRRSDADVAATLKACKLPIQCAEKIIQPGAEDNEPDYALAKEIAELVEDNLFGGLEYENSAGDKFSQPFDSVIENALLSLDFGCAGSEDLWAIDQNRVRLTRLAPRLPMTFYQFFTDQDGETLREVVQWGYRGDQWVTASIPANKFTLFSYRMEGSNFYGRAICREMYQHWFMKSALYKIDAIACERAAAGVPTIEQGPSPDATSVQQALDWVTQLAANESTGLSLPNGWKFTNQGVTGSLHPVLPSIQHHSEMICRAPVAMFMALGTTQSGSRSLGNTMVDFFQLMEETIARFVCDTISDTTIRRIVDFNFPRGKGKTLPYPRLAIPHIAVINPLELAQAIKDLANVNTQVIQPDDKFENWFRKKFGAPKKDKFRVRYGNVMIRDESMPAPTDTPEDIEENRAEPQIPGGADADGAVPTRPRVSQTADVKQRNVQQLSVTLSRQLENRLKWHGLNISIENDKGSTRNGVGKDGKPWSVAMQHPYGYIRRTEGVDGDHIDCFMGPDKQAEFVYVVHQKEPTTGSYDEDKCMLDFPNEAAAKDAFLVNYSDPRFFHSMTILPVAEFIEKVKATFDQPQKITASELSRDLKPHEHKHDFMGHAKRQDQTQTAIRRILGGVKPALIRDAARRASVLEPKSLDTMTMPFDHALAARLAKSAAIAAKYGHDKVYAERFLATKRPKSERVKLSKTADVVPGASAAEDKPGLIAEAAVSDLNNWITSRARGAHIDAYKRGLRDDDLERSIIDDLREGSDAYLDRIAAEAARSGVAGGRFSALQELAGEIARYVRSEAMDRNTCGPCEKGDGAEWDSLAEVDWSPGDDCEGSDACRGQLLPIFSDEGMVTLG